MRHHTIKFLNELSKDGKKISDEQILSWANKKASECQNDRAPPIEVNKFNDQRLKDGLFFIKLLAACRPKIIDWDLVTDGESADDAMLNARYAISIARKM